MAEVYVLSGRKNLTNSEYGLGIEDVCVFDVYVDFEKAKKAFETTVMEIAEELSDTEDDFEYTKDTLFQNCDSDGESFGWFCAISDNWCEWNLNIPETDYFDFGVWFKPVVYLQKIEIK